MNYPDDYPSHRIPPSDMHVLPSSSLLFGLALLIPAHVSLLCVQRFVPALPLSLTLSLSIPMHTGACTPLNQWSVPPCTWSPFLCVCSFVHRMVLDSNTARFFSLPPYSVSRSANASSSNAIDALPVRPAFAETRSLDACILQLPQNECTYGFFLSTPFDCTHKSARCSAPISPGGLPRRLYHPFILEPCSLFSISSGVPPGSCID